MFLFKWVCPWYSLFLFSMFLADSALLDIDLFDWATLDRGSFLLIIEYVSLIKFDFVCVLPIFVWFFHIFGLMSIIILLVALIFIFFLSFLHFPNKIIHSIGSIIRNSRSVEWLLCLALFVFLLFLLCLIWQLLSLCKWFWFWWSNNLKWRNLYWGGL